jgi:hypothetical protein
VSFIETAPQRCKPSNVRPRTIKASPAGRGATARAVSRERTAGSRCVREAEGCDEPGAEAEKIARRHHRRDDPEVNRAVGTRLLRLAGLWVLCSAGALVLFIAIGAGAHRLVLAAKLEGIGAWGLYIGLPLQSFANAMLAPATASRIAEVPDWLHAALDLTAVAAWGAAAAAAIRWAARRAGRRTILPGAEGSDL